VFNELGAEKIVQVNTAPSVGTVYVVPFKTPIPALPTPVMLFETQPLTPLVSWM
jgi:hypothetical protein